MAGSLGTRAAKRVSIVLIVAGSGDRAELCHGKHGCARTSQCEAGDGLGRWDLQLPEEKGPLHIWPWKGPMFLLFTLLVTTGPYTTDFDTNSFNRRSLPQKA